MRFHYSTSSPSDSTSASLRAKGAYVNRKGARTSLIRRDDLAQLRQGREICAILRSFGWIVAEARLAAFERSEPEHACAHTGQFSEFSTDLLVRPQHRTRTQRDVDLSPLPLHDESQLEANRLF